MKLIPTLLIITTAAVPFLTGCERSQPAAAKAATSPGTYSLRGTILEIRSADSELLIKHEEIPGLMPAMTMPFKVDSGTLKIVAPGQAITATLVQRSGTFSLRDVRPATSGTASLRENTSAVSRDAKAGK